MTGHGLLERGDVLATIGEVLDAARDGRGGALLIVGEAGMGKTALTEAARAACAGLECVAARAEPMERAVPFGLIDQALRGLGLATVVGEREAAVEPSAPFFRALRELEAHGRPLALLLDDLHEADADSLALLAFVVRRASRLPLAVIATMRPWPAEAAESLRPLVDGGEARLETLRPLSPQASAQLMRHRLRSSAGEQDISRAWDLCQGNPLLIEQACLALGRGDALPAAAHDRVSVDHLLLARFAGYGRDGLALVQAASVLGVRFRPELPLALAGLDEGTAIDEGLFRSGLLVEEPDGSVRFVHALFAQAVYDDLTAGARQRLHARAFALLADRGLDAEAGEHAMRADLVGDPRAAAVLERSGRAALASGALATAVRHLDAAVAVSAASPAAELLLLRGEALLASGRAEEAVAACRALLDAATLGWEQRIAALRFLGRAQYLAGSAGRGDGALAEAITLAVAHDAPGQAVGPLLDQSLTAWLAGGPRLALPLAARARELAQVSGDADLRRRADAAWGHLASESGDGSGFAGTAAAAAAVADGSLPLDPVELAWPWASVYHSAMGDNYAERLPRAERTFKRARAVMEDAGAANALATLAIYVANNVIRQGRIAEALAEAVRAREFSDLTPGVLAYADAMRAEALCWSGELAESERWCRAAEDGDVAQAWFLRLWVAHVRGLRLLWQGDAAASDELLVAEEVTNEVGIREPCHMQWAGHAIAAHIAVGRLDDAERIVNWLAGCAAGLPCRWPRIGATLGRAQLAAAQGDDAAAETAFAAALRLHDEVDLPLLRTEALLAQGAWLRRRGKLVPARQTLAEAAQIAGACGAGWLGREALAELRLAGGRRRSDSADRDELTEAEQRVASLAADGHSNAEIARRLVLSVNTIETHLRHVYAKLGIHSRRELMRLAITGTGEAGAPADSDPDG